MPKNFWSKVDKEAPGGCWLWTGATRPNGYGNFGVCVSKGVYRTVGAHRFSYELQYGPLEEGQLVLHRCDVRNCVNPAHLFVGDAATNTEDMIRKRRDLPSRPRKLNPEWVCQLREQYSNGSVSMNELARRHGLSVETVRRVVCKISWKHVE